ncbi:MAG: LysE family translocator, partial [Rhodospirillales bacterium]|nr:LysE family translocator [Rhodospirillales bacterium]
TTLNHGDIAIIAAVVSGMLFFVMVVYAWLAARSRRMFRSERAVRIMNRSAGTVMIGAGAVIATRQ